MGRRIMYGSKKRTYAPGEREAITGNRFWVHVDLVSIALTEKSFLEGKTSEIYFEINRGRRKIRVPQAGAIHLEENEVFTPKDESFSLWNEFVESKEGNILLTIKIKEENIGLDETLVKQKISIPLGSGADYMILKGENVKCKIKVAAPRTRF